MEELEKTLNDYLDQIAKYLKPLAVTERIDIIKEIQSEMLELQSNGNSPAQITERLGNPKELAKAYLGESISKDSHFSWRKLSAIITFYSFAGLSGMFVLPFASICGITFMFTGILSPILGIIKFIAYLLGQELPQIGIQINSYTVSAAAFLPISFIIGILSFSIGWFFWKLTILTIKTMSSGKKKLKEIE